MKKSPVRLPVIQFRLPRWIRGCLSDGPAEFQTHTDRMRFVIRMSRLNIEKGTGGPFAAAIFDRATGTLVAPGVNMVTAAGSSVAHAEIVAIMTAQRLTGCYDLGRKGADLEIVSSTEPCAMCQGAVIWSGVSGLVCGARGDDAILIGFDEGPKSRDWVAQLRRRGIAVKRDVCRREAAAVLKEYMKLGGEIYNGSRRAPRRASCAST